MADRSRQSPYSPRGSESLLAGPLWNRSGQNLGKLRIPGRGPQPPGVARLVGCGFSRTWLGRETVAAPAGQLGYLSPGFALDGGPQRTRSRKSPAGAWPKATTHGRNGARPGLVPQWLIARRDRRPTCLPVSTYQPIQGHRRRRRLSRHKLYRILRPRIVSPQFVHLLEAHRTPSFA